jgi:hypothetical protein
MLMPWMASQLLSFGSLFVVGVVVVVVVILGEFGLRFEVYPITLPNDKRIPDQLLLPLSLQYTTTTHH